MKPDMDKPEAGSARHWLAPMLLAPLLLLAACEEEAPAPEEATAPVEESAAPVAPAASAGGDGAETEEAAAAEAAAAEEQVATEEQVSPDEAPEGAPLAPADTVIMAPEGPSEPSLSGNYLAGIHAENEQDLIAAGRFYTRALEEDPDNQELLRTNFAIALRNGHYERAVALAERVLANQPEEPTASILMAVRDAVAGDPVAAEARLTDLPRVRVSEIVLPMVVGWIRALDGDWDAAVEALEPLAGRPAFRAFHDLHVALIRELQGNRDAAEQAYLASLAQEEQPPARLVQAVAAFYQAEGRDGDAAAIVGRFAESSPASELMQDIQARIAAGERLEPLVGSAIDGLAESLFDMASAFFQEGAHRFALIYGRLALLARPDFPVARMLIGELLESRERHVEAAEMFGTIPPESSFYHTARMRIATALNALERIEEAVAVLEEVAAARPDDPAPLIDIGDFLRADSRFEEAVDAYDRAFARLPEVMQRHWPLLYSRGIALERSGDWERAEADFLRALELEPQQPYVLNYLGYTWVERGENLDEARQMIVSAVDQRPTDGYIVDSLGWVLYRLGDYETAVRHLEQAVELRPEDPVINDHLGDAYWRVGRHQEARFQWHRALSLDPEEDQIAIIGDKLENGLGPVEEASAPTDDPNDN